MENLRNCFKNDENVKIIKNKKYDIYYSCTHKYPLMTIERLDQEYENHENTENTENHDNHENYEHSSSNISQKINIIESRVRLRKFD